MFVYWWVPYSDASASHRRRRWLWERLEDDLNSSCLCTAPFWIHFLCYSQSFQPFKTCIFFKTWEKRSHACLLSAAGSRSFWYCSPAFIHTRVERMMGHTETEEWPTGFNNNSGLWKEWGRTAHLSRERNKTCEYKG